MQSGVSWGVEWVFNLVPDVVYFYFTHQGDSRCLHKHMCVHTPINSNLTYIPTEQVCEWCVASYIQSYYRCVALTYQSFGYIFSVFMRCLTACLAELVPQHLIFDSEE